MRTACVLWIWAASALAAEPAVPGAPTPSPLEAPPAASAEPAPITTPPAEPSVAAPDAPLQSPPWSPDARGDALYIRPPLSGGRSAALVSMTTASVLATTALGGAVFSVLYGTIFRSLGGRPDPLLSGAAGALAFGLHVGASQLLTPLPVLAVDEGVPGGVAAARAKGWKWSRWPLLGAAAGFAVYTAGAAMDNKNFGSGQALILAGGATVVTSYLVYTVLEAVGVVVGYEQYRAGIRN